MIRGNEKTLPRQGIIDGKIVTNYHLLPLDLLLSEGWIDEEYQPTLDELKLTYVNQAKSMLDEIANQGIKSTCLGEEKTFSTDATSIARINGLVTIAQQNLINQMLGLSVERSKTPWKDASTNVCFEFTDQQIIQLGGEIGNAIIELEHQKELAEEAIMSATSKEELEVIMSAFNS